MQNDDEPTMQTMMYSNRGRDFCLFVVTAELRWSGCSFIFSSRILNNGLFWRRIVTRRAVIPVRLRWPRLIFDRDVALVPVDL